MKQQRSQFRAIRGVRDILPPESALWNRVEQTAHDVFATYNFQEIRLPIFEETELFARSVGADTDIVSKEMYTFARKLEFLRENIGPVSDARSEEHTSELQSRLHLVCRILLEKKNIYFK